MTMRMRFSFLLVALAGCFRVVSSQTSLASGTVTTLTNVQQYADLAQDLAELQKYVATGATDRFLSLFRNGLHSQDSSGNPFALADLGDALETSTDKTPAFLYHLHGITDRSTNFPFELAGQQDYINKFVEEIATENLNYGVDAILTVSVWMYATHLLYDGVYRCHLQTKADDPTQLSPLGGAGFDEFIALYIGEGQELGTDSGDSLYRWSQVMGDFFGTTDPETPVNTNIVLLYKKAKDALSVEGACTSAVPGTVTELWKIATMIVSQMSIPLFQGLLYSVIENDADGAKVYAKALVPQTAKCRPSTYKRLKQNLLDEGVNLGAAAQILEDLQAAYACFGYTCKAIGNYNNDERLECNVDKYNPSLAGYDPLTDVSAVRCLLVDLQCMLSAFGGPQFSHMIFYTGGTGRLGCTPNSYSCFVASKQFCRVCVHARHKRVQIRKHQHRCGVCGKCANKSNQGRMAPLKTVTIHTKLVPHTFMDLIWQSMHDIAVSTERSNAPSYALFRDYHDERDYADKIVQKALSGDSKWLATEQVAATASFACAYMITFMEAISKLRIGVADCRAADGGLSYTLDPVDEAAALIVGSMGGHQEGGAVDSEDGQLMYSLANNVGFQFATLNDNDYAIVNEDIINLLLAARAEIDVLDCDSLELSVDLLEKYLTVGIIQGAILAAIRNENLSSISTATSLAEGESLSLAVLPYFKKSVPQATALIEDNMIWRSGKQPVQAGAAEVAHSFGRGLAYGVGLRCSFLGSTEGVNPCGKVPSDVGTTGIEAKPSAGMKLTSSLATLLLLGAVSTTWLLLGL